jgi:hypothetical protein
MGISTGSSQTLQVSIIEPGLLKKNAISTEVAFLHSFFENWLMPFHIHRAGLFFTCLIQSSSKAFRQLLCIAYTPIM